MNLSCLFSPMTKVKKKKRKVKIKQSCAAQETKRKGFASVVNGKKSADTEKKSKLQSNKI